MEIRLTKDADYLLCVLYKKYKEDRENGVDKAIAKQCGSSKHINETMLNDWLYKDVEETCRELERSCFLQCHGGDGIVCRSCLTDDAIIYMENRFSDGVKGLLEHMSKIKSAFSLF